MVITYANGVITVTLEGDETDVADYIFSQPSANDLVRIQFEKMFNQRRVQQESEIKDQLFADFQITQTAQKVKA